MCGPHAAYPFICYLDCLHFLSMVTNAALNMRFSRKCCV